MHVTIHHILTGPAASVGGVRFDIDGEAHILLAQHLTVDDQAELLGELLAPEDTVVYATVVVPAQRAEARPTELAG